MLKRLKAAKDEINKKVKNIDIGIITGTGINININSKKIVTMRYSDIASMPVPTTKAHKGYFDFFDDSKKTVAIANGRFHYYEVYTMQEVVFLARLLGMLGAKLVILTNSAGGLNTSFKIGNLMLIRDHINMMGVNPLKGDNIDELGERFPDMSEAYSLKYNDILKKTALSSGIDLKEGVYIAVAGPSMETPAETKFLSLIGADAVGMSTVPEVIALNHMNVDCVGISVITNINKPDCMVKTPEYVVIEEAKRASNKLSLLIDKFLEKIEV